MRAADRGLSAWDKSYEGRKATWGGLDRDDYFGRLEERCRAWPAQVREWIRDQWDHSADCERTEALWHVSLDRQFRATSVEWASLYAAAEELCALSVAQRNQARRARRQAKARKTAPPVPPLGLTIEQPSLFGSLA